MCLLRDMISVSIHMFIYLYICMYVHVHIYSWVYGGRQKYVPGLM